MTRMLVGLFALLATVAAALADTEPWTSQHHRDHPLVGQIWSVGDGTTVSRSELAERIRMAEFLLLGEIHPNPDHHRLQAWAVEAATQKDRSPAVVFEMIPFSKQASLDAHLKSRPRDAAGLGDALDWKKSGWPAWTLYQPIAEAALRNGLPILAGNLDRSTTRQVAKSGSKALSEEQRQRYGIDEPLDKKITTLMDKNLADSHCGLLPKRALAPMAVVQRSRDGAMAATMLDAARDHGAAILVAGSGHVRRDWAVPAIIERSRTNANILTIAFMEVLPDWKSPSDYLPESPLETPVYDFLYFTPRSEIKDYCAELKKQFGKPGNKKSNG